MAKIQKVVMAIWMVVVAMGMFDSCSKYDLEGPQNPTAWDAPKKKSNPQKEIWEEIVENFTFSIKTTPYEGVVTRPLGAYGEAIKVVTVEAETDLSGVKYVEGKQTSEKSNWENGQYWSGTQVTRTQNFRLTNAKYGAEFSDNWYSTDAYFQKDTLKAEFPDAQWHRSVKLDSTDVYNKSVDGQKGYYKVRDFIATVTNVASVKDGFVKDASKASKTFTTKDTLSLRFYVAPDPEDEFVRRWNEVELYKEGEKIVGDWIVKEEWTISGVREVYRKSVDFTAWAKGYDGDVVYATNTAYQTTTEKWNGTGSKALVTTAKNGIATEKFDSHFEVYGDKDVTLTYEDQAVTFKANLAHEAVKQTIGDAKLTLINGTYYNISPYKAEIFPVYTVTCGEKSAKLELEAESNCQLRVKANANVVIENQEFKANFKAEGAKLYHEVGQYANSWDEVEYTETVETGRNNVVRKLNLSGEVNTVGDYEVADPAQLGKLKVSSIKGSTSVTSKTDGSFSKKTAKTTVTATFDNGKTQTIDFTVESETAQGMKLGSADIDYAKITCKIDTLRVDENTMQIVPKYTVPVLISKLDGKTQTEEFVIYKPFNEFARQEVIENQKYEAKFVASGANLTTEKNANTWDQVTYVNGVETGRKTVSHDLIVEAAISGAQPFTVDSKDNLIKEYKITSVTRTGNQVSTYTGNDGVKREKTVQNFNVTINNGQTLNVKVTTEKDLTEGMTLSHTYCETVKAAGVEASVSGNTVTLTPKVNVLLVEDNGVATKAAVGEAKAYTIETSMVGTYTPETKVVRVPSIENGEIIVRTYNDVDGDRTLVNTEKFTPYSSLQAEAGSDVYAKNSNFSTTFNGKSSVTSGTGTTQDHFTSTRENGKVTSTMSNGAVKADNIGNYSYDKTIVYKNGNDTFTFVGSVNFTENTDPIVANGIKTINNVAYDAYAYKTTFTMAYTMTEATAGTADLETKSASVSRDILIEKEAEDIVPGTIKWIALRAVAAIPDGNGGYKNADGHLNRIKGIAVGTEEGKVCYIPFADAADGNAFLPTADQFANANWQTASYYNESYVAGYDKAKNGVWYPATVEDLSNQILYFDNGQAVRSLTQKSMNTWGWSNQTSVVDGYTISEVKNGVVTITFNGQTRVIK